MYQYNGNHIEINNNSINFEYDIRDVIQYQEKYIVLLGIPFECQAINNIYCLDTQAKIVWRAEDLSKLYPQLLNLAYEHMSIKDGSIWASDFYGRNYKININTGKIEARKIAK